MAAPFNLASQAQASNPAIRKHFVDKYKESDPKIEAVLMVDTQQDYIEQHQNYSGMGDLEVIDEGQRYPEDAPIQTYGTTFTSVKYGKVLSLTYESEYWDKSGIKDQKTKVEMRAKATARSIGRKAADLFNNGFNSNFTSYGDNVELFGSHPRADGGAAQSNAFALPLNPSNLETVKLGLEQVLDDKGQEVTYFANRLVVPYELRRTALQVVHSELAQGTADNDINTFNPKGSLKTYEGATIDQVIAWRYLTDANAWFVLADDHKVCWLWGEKPVMDDVDDQSGNLSDVAYWKVRYQADTGWDDWRGVAGSNPS